MTITFLKQHKILLLLWIALVIASQKIHLSFLLGGNHLSLSCLAVVVPLIGFFFSRSHSLFLSTVAWLLTHLTWALPLTLGLPTLCATLSWNASAHKRSLHDLSFHVLLPLLCMLLFFLSPVGHSAWPYSLYWCLPITLYFLTLKGPLALFSRALQSTFTAHAIGSVIWVYFTDMTSAHWLSLIPIVALERLCMASISVALILALKAAQESFCAKQCPLTDA